MLQIFNPTDKLPVSSIMTVIYGDAGIGKTTFASQCPDSLLLDFEQGAGRAKKRTQTAPVDNWADVLDFIKSGKAKELGIKTLIFDTVGTLLDRQLTNHLIKEDAKRGSSNGLTLQGYGAMKKSFDYFINLLKDNDINAVFIAHKELFKDGDDTKYRPKMTGGSYDILIAIADLVGYYEMKGGKRILNFRPTDRSIGKDTAEFGQIVVPEYTDNEFDGIMQRLIDQTAERMSSLSQEQEKALVKLDELKQIIAEAEMGDAEDLLEAMKGMDKIYEIQLKKLLSERMKEEWSKRVEVVTTPAEADLLLSDIENYPKVFAKVLQAVLWAKAKDLSFEYNKSQGAFIDPKAQTPATPEEATVTPDPELPLESK